jgi:demethylmenaquinone methyltransferase/2-methoxy-6-polyprenyl-1,4-benzoquinol methylase
METSYGFRDVAAGDKQPLVNDVFHKRRQALRHHERLDVGRIAPALEGRNRIVAQSAETRWLERALDVAGGTGDVAFRIVEASAVARRMSPCSISTARCSASGASAPRKRALPPLWISSKPMQKRCHFHDASFDAYTIAFGIRNVPRIDVALCRSLPRAQDRRALLSVSSSLKSTCRCSTRSMRRGLSAPFRESARR